MVIGQLTDATTVAIRLMVLLRNSRGNQTELLHTSNRHRSVLTAISAMTAKGGKVLDVVRFKTNNERKVTSSSCWDPLSVSGPLSIITHL